MGKNFCWHYYLTFIVYYLFDLNLLSILTLFLVNNDYISWIWSFSLCGRVKSKICNIKCFRLFDWRPDKLRGERSKHESVVIVKNLFDPKIFDKEVSLLLEYQQDLREECSKCGDVKKVIIFDVSMKCSIYNTQKHK